MADRLALIIANSDFDDPKLRRLKTPIRDAEALAEVLGDPDRRQPHLAARGGSDANRANHGLSRPQGRQVPGGDRGRGGRRDRQRG